MGRARGAEYDSAKDSLREAVNLPRDDVINKGYDIPLAIEPNPHGPRGDILQPMLGRARGHRAPRRRPVPVGLNPDFRPGPYDGACGWC